MEEETRGENLAEVLHFLMGKQGLNATAERVGLTVDNSRIRHPEVSLIREWSLSHIYNIYILIIFIYHYIYSYSTNYNCLCLVENCKHSPILLIELNRLLRPAVADICHHVAKKQALGKTLTCSIISIDCIITY